MDDHGVRNMGKYKDSNRNQEDSRTQSNLRQKQRFDRIASSFDGMAEELAPDVNEKLEAIVDSAGIRPGEVVLDVGSGTGVLLALILRKKPARIVACDLSSEMLAQAREKFGSAVEYLQLDVCDLPASQGPFDVVFCNGMFGNIYDQQLALQTIHGLLNDGGRLIISHPLGRDFVRRIKENNPEIKELPDGSRIESFVEPHGFSLVQFVDDPEYYLAVIEKN